MDNLEELQSTIGSQEDYAPVSTKAPCVPLKDALWQCSNEFNKKGNTFKDLDFKRVWLFSNDDNPNCKYPQEQLQIIQVAKDAAETGIEVSLWHMNKVLCDKDGNKTGFSPFNIDIFYNKILVVDDDDELLYRTRGVWLLCKYDASCLLYAFANECILSFHLCDCLGHNNYRCWG